MLRMHFGNSEELSLIAPHRWERSKVAQFFNLWIPSKEELVYSSGGSRGGAQGARSPSPLFLDQTEARRAQKNFLGDRPPHPLILRSGSGTV